MSKHVWLIKKFNPRTVRMAADAATGAFTTGLGFDDACRAVGYVVETIRQAGGHHWQAVLERCGRGGWKALRGRNAANYLLAGMALLSAAAPAWGLDAGAPANAVADRILEKLAGDA